MAHDTRSPAHHATGRTDVVLDRVLATTTEPRARLVLLLRRRCGLGTGEIAAARWEHLDGGVLEVGGRFARSVELGGDVVELAREVGGTVALVPSMHDRSLGVRNEVIRRALVEAVEASPVPLARWEATTRRMDRDRRAVESVPVELAEHLETLALRNLRASTIYQRRRTIMRLARYLGDVGLLDVSAEELSDFLSRPLSAESRATEISHLRSFYRWAWKTRRTGEDLGDHLERPKLARRLPRPAEPADLAHAIEEANERVRPWLYLAAFAGLRCHEIAHLRREDVLDHHEPPVLVVVDGKGGRQRVVPLAVELVEELRRWDLPRSGWLFTRRDGLDGPVAPHTVSHIGARHLRACGVPATMHQLRHLFGTTMYRRTRDLRVVQELLGHSSPATTAGYAAWSPEAAAVAVRDLSYT